jgi:hypothetical protein
MLKRWMLSLVLLAGLFACGAQVEKTTALPPAPGPAPVILTATPFIQTTATAAPKFIPKQNDLIFVEFFAVT